jgi:hypothetical protein
MFHWVARFTHLNLRNGSCKLNRFIQQRRQSRTRRNAKLRHGVQASLPFFDDFRMLWRTPKKIRCRSLLETHPKSEIFIGKDLMQSVVQSEEVKL